MNTQQVLDLLDLSDEEGAYDCEYVESDLELALSSSDSDSNSEGNGV